MNSRERVGLILNHQEADRVPLDLGGSGTTGMHVDSVYLLRQALRLDAAGTPVKVIDPFQMLGEIAPDLVAVLDWLSPAEHPVVVMGPDSVVRGF